MKVGWPLLLLLANCAALAADGAPDPQLISMAVGDTQVLDAPDVRRVAVGNGRVASVSAIDARQLLILAEAPGTTSVRLWQSEGRLRELRISVAAIRGADLLARVIELLGDSEHLRAHLVGEQVVVEGERVSQQEREQLAAIVKALPGQVLDLTGRVGWDAMIQMQVSIVEVRHSRGDSLGLRWLEQIAGPQLQFQLASDGTRTSSLSWNAALGSTLQLLVKRGVARLVAEPALSCRSGGHAHFVSGGEMPVPVLNGNGTPDVQYKEYGIILDIQPSTDRHGNVYALVQAEVSDVDNAVQVMGIPGLLKRHSTTEVNARLGETIVIAGLTRRAQSRDRQGLPWLSAVPVAGSLFRARSSDWSESELLLFITPKLVAAQPADPGEDATLVGAAPLERARQLQSAQIKP